MRTLYRNGRVHTAAARERDRARSSTAARSPGSASRTTRAAHRPAAATIDLRRRLRHARPSSTRTCTRPRPAWRSPAWTCAARARWPRRCDAVERAARAGRGRPILGGGWDETDWPERRPPTAAELDRAAYGGSVYLARVDVHSAVVSSALLAAVPGLAGLAGFRADGWLRRDAHDAVRAGRATPALTPAQRRDAQRAALRHARRARHRLRARDGRPGDLRARTTCAALLALGRDEPLPEVIGYWGELFGVDDGPRARRRRRRRATCSATARSARTPPRCTSRTPTGPSTAARCASTTERARRAHRAPASQAGLQAGFHAIGDAAVDQVLDAFELAPAAARAARPAPGTASSTPSTSATRPRLAASGLLASMQPVFDAAWGGAERHVRRRGSAPSGRAALNRFADLAAAGVPLAFGSDSPVTAARPVGRRPGRRPPARPGARRSARGPRSPRTPAAAGGRPAAPARACWPPGAPATFAVWRAGELGVDARRAGGPLEHRPARRRAGLPDLAPGVGCRRACDRRAARSSTRPTAPAPAERLSRTGRPRGVRDTGRCRDRCAGRRAARSAARWAALLAVAGGLLGVAGVPAVRASGRWRSSAWRCCRSPCDGRRSRTGAWLGFALRAGVLRPAAALDRRLRRPGAVADPRRRRGRLLRRARRRAAACSQRLRGAPAVGRRAPGCSQEALRDRLPFGGFPWGRLAFSQADVAAAVVRRARRRAAASPSPSRWPAAGARRGRAAALRRARLPRPSPPASPSRSPCRCSAAAARAPLAPGAGPRRPHRRSSPSSRAACPTCGLAFEQRARQVLDNHVAPDAELAAEITAGTVPRPEPGPVAGERLRRRPVHRRRPPTREIDDAVQGDRRPGPRRRDPAGPGPDAPPQRRHPLVADDRARARSTSSGTRCRSASTSRCAASPRLVSSDVNLVTQDMVAGHGNGLLARRPGPDRRRHLLRGRLRRPGALVGARPARSCSSCRPTTRPSATPPRPTSSWR